MTDFPNCFAGLRLDRRSEARESDEWVASALADSRTVYVVSQGTRQLLHSDSEPRIALLRGDDPAVRAAQERQFVLLGWNGEVRYVLLDAEPDLPLPLTEGLSFQELRSIAAALSQEDAALLAYARALSIWRARHRYCGSCGAPTAPRNAGHVLRCTNEPCAHETFPRLDPAIIVLVSDGERALLGRQAAWDPGRYSTLAGFVEPGESLEEAVVREVWEETGIRVYSSDYRSSQPWPFPSSLMIGFQALGEYGPIRLSAELEDARWFTRQDIASQRVVLPPTYSISYRLIAEWLNAQD